MVYPGRVWINGGIRMRHPWPGDLVRVWCRPSLAATAGGRPAGRRATLAQSSLDGEHSLGPPRVWPKCTAQGRVVSVLLNRRETIVELEVFPGQEGWTRLLRLYSQLRKATPPSL